MLIAHDLGTSGDKASLYDLDGTLVTSVTESYPTSLRSRHPERAGPGAPP